MHHKILKDHRAPPNMLPRTPKRCDHLWLGHTCFKLTDGIKNWSFMQSARSERNISLNYASTVSIKSNKAERPKNCNGETASGFALLACRFTIRGIGMDSPWTPLACLKNSTNISSLSLKAWITSLQLVILVASKAVKIIS